MEHSSPAPSSSIQPGPGLTPSYWSILPTGEYPWSGPQPTLHILQLEVLLESQESQLLKVQNYKVLT